MPEAEAPAPDPGAQFLAEIHEQPEALLRLLDHQVAFARVAEQARERGTSMVRIVGHGSSIEGAERSREAGATLIASGAAADAIPDAAYRLPLLGSPLLGPLLSVVPGQLFAWALARARGLDPDHPRGLSKATLAR